MKINGIGTIEKRGRGSWRIRFNLGIDKETGKYKYTPWRTVKGTKADATAARERYRQELEGGLKLDADRMTFSIYAERWADNRRDMGTLSPSSLRLDKQIITILNEYIGSMSLSEIDALTIETMLATHSKQKGASPDQLHRMYFKLKQILEDAVNKDYILRNPCNKVKAPKVPRPDLRYLSAAEVQRLMRALADTEQNHVDKYRPDYARQTVTHSHVMAVRLALATGMRRGEILGLSWGSVGLDTGNLRITQSMTSDGLRKPKTQNSNRLLSLDANTMQRLRAWKEEQGAFLSSLGITQCLTTPVISNEIGGRHDPAHFSRWWRMFTAANGFKGLKLHELRHTQATLLFGQGMDIKTVQNRLGHTMASTTLDVYAGVIPGKDREAADIMGAILTTESVPETKIVNL